MNKDQKLEEIYKSIQVLIKNNHFGFVNNFISDLIPKIWRTDPDELIQYALATLESKIKLPSRGRFIKRCQEVYPNVKSWETLK